MNSHVRSFSTNCLTNYRLLLPIAMLLITVGCGGGAGSSPSNSNSQNASQQIPAPTNPTPTPATTLKAAGQPHGITLGAAARYEDLGESAYATTLSTQYGELEAENAMMMRYLLPQTGSYDFTNADLLVSFAKQNSMLVRGNHLVWYAYLPTWLTSGNYTPAQLSVILQNYISTVAGHYAGEVYAWNVVNEPFNDDGSMRPSLWYDSPGIGFAGQGTAYIEQALKWAHTADPTAKLFVNENHAEALNAKSDALYAMAHDFLERGVPLDGIGFQFHLQLSDDLSQVAANFARFSDLGLEIHITELDIALDDDSSASLDAQASMYAQVVNLCMTNPHCKLIQTWGFTDKYSWIPNYTSNKQGWALPFDANYNEKPAWTSMMQVLNGQ